MWYRLLADLTATVHMAFIAYVVVGGFLVWRWPRTIWAHLLAAAWGLGSVVVGYPCPLTFLENWARVRGGGQPLPETGFIDHYLTGVIYPASALTAVRVLVLACVLISWGGHLWRLRRESGSAGPAFPG